MTRRKNKQSKSAIPQTLYPHLEAQRDRERYDKRDPLGARIQEPQPVRSGSKTADRFIREVKILIVRDGPCCHYCKKVLNMKNATRDHVIPKRYKGPNKVDNYVLACEKCNNSRGYSLDWCRCDFCANLIVPFKKTKPFVDSSLEDLVRFNKPHIKQERRSGQWKVHMHHQTAILPNYSEALAYALSH